jgi:hypothetical protein
MTRCTLAALLASTLLSAAKHPQKIADGQADNANVSVKSTIYIDPGSIQEVLGSDLQGHYIVVQVQLTPKGKFTIDLDNFTLRTDKDGERSHPFKPTQIAGDGALVISDTALAGGGAASEPSRPTWSGGIGGMGSRGRGAGNAATTTGSKATEQAATGKKDPLLDVLTAKMLPEKETDQPVSGFLYFPMEKQKVKDMELICVTPAGKLNLRFK